MSYLDPFDPVSTAKEVIGQLTEAVMETPRNKSITAQPERETFKAALILQAGLRALLPVSEREDVALPKIFPNDAQELQDAQRNYAAIYKSGAIANQAQQQVAFQAIETAAHKFKEQGYEAFSAAVNTWLADNGAVGPVLPIQGTKSGEKAVPKP